MNYLSRPEEACVALGTSLSQLKVLVNQGLP